MGEAQEFEGMAGAGKAQRELAQVDLSKKPPLQGGQPGHPGSIRRVPLPKSRRVEPLLAQAGLFSDRPLQFRRQTD